MDKDKFEKLVRDYQRSVMSFSYRSVSDWSAADDITQETFVAAWKNLSSLKDPSSIKSWLFKIALNKSRSYLRWKKVRNFVSLDAFIGEDENSSLKDLLRDEASPSPADLAFSSVRQEAVNKAINSLPGRQREVILLRLQEFSLREISGILGIAEGTVKAHLFEAKARLKKIFEEGL